MMGWGLGERPDLLFDHGDNNNDLDSEKEWVLGNFLERMVPFVTRI